jgi:UTP-glucose-1-phosphate uridylyltransferase
MLDTAVIPCGGLGTRLQPITRWLLKELLPVGLRPVFYWTLDEIAGAGLQRVILITSPLKPALQAAALVAAPNGPLASARSGARPATVRDGAIGLEVTDVALSSAPLDTAGGRPARLVGRFVFPGDVFAELDAVARAAPAGAEVDGLAVLHALAHRGQLAGALAQAAWYEVGLPDGYRSAVAEFPARA